MTLHGRMLITGISGLLGNNLGWYFKEKFDVLGLYNEHPVDIEGLSSTACNITNAHRVNEIVNEFIPHVIIHCASLTNVDQCERERNQTQQINVQATQNIVKSIDDHDTAIVYISTDSVYDGISGQFKEEDNPTPNNYYGLSKFRGELEVLKAKRPLALRTNIFGWNIQNKKSLGEWILHSLQGNNKINGFADAYFSSIYTMELARIIDLSIQNRLTGVFNCGSRDYCSKYEFAMKIADWFGLNRSLIAPISIDDFDFLAYRGKNLNLDMDKIQKALSYRLPTIDYSIESFYRDYQSGLPKQIKSAPKTVYPDNTAVIPYGRQWIDNRDIQIVTEVLRSDRITQGSKVDRFETKLAQVCNAKHAVAVNSGTSGLHIACLVAGIGKGDEVITSPITFVASANSVAYCGGTPVFADIDNRTFNISPDEIKNRINSRTKAVIPVHFAGQSCEMEEISQIVKSAENKFGHKIFIIEDACHALGSKYKDTSVGSCHYSDMAVTSFHPVKHITTGPNRSVIHTDGSCYSLYQIQREFEVYQFL